MHIPRVVMTAAERGWSVFPVGLDKRPLGRWKQYQDRRPTRDDLRTFATRNPAAWAVITGKVSKLLILDFDGDDGNRLLKALNLKPHVRTGSGGAHVYFEHPGWTVPTLNSKSSKELNKRWAGLDIRADGGYAVFWGQNHNGRYRWLRKADLEPLSILPADLRQFLHLLNPPGPTSASASSPVNDAQIGDRLLDRALRNARTDGRNNAGFWYACQLRDNGVPEQLARGLMERYAANVGPTNQKGKDERYTVAEAHASLRKAYSAAPRDPTPQRRTRPARPAVAEQPSQPKQVAVRVEPQEHYLAEAGPYRLSKRGLWLSKVYKDGTHGNVRLTNFPAVLSADVVRDDGEATSRALKIHATVKGEERDIIVKATDFALMNWPLEELGTAAIVYPNLKDHTRTAMQELSREITEQYVYQHVGWTQIRDQFVYLHNDGAIGAGGVVNGVAVDLERELRRYTLPAPLDGRALRDGIAASLRMLDTAPDRVTLPIYCAVWRSILGICDVSIHLAGQTGSGKSQLAALAQQHFGAGMDAKHLPATWDSTANALQAICFYAKNAICVVDDFVPRGAASDVARLHREADRLLRSQGNHAGRQRMSADAKIRPPKTPRGIILSTGEDIPKGNSLRARLVVIEMDPQDMRWDVLTGCQHAAGAGTYAAVMASFIQWAAPQMPDMQRRIYEQLATFREHWGSGGSHHMRTPDNLANLNCGLELFMDFAREAGALNLRQANALQERVRVAFEDAAREQEKAQTHAEPTTQFLELVRSCLTSGLGHLLSREGEKPADLPACGWKKDNGEWRPQGPKIGWEDDEYIYLDPKASFAVAQELGRKISDAVPVSIQTLGRRMKQRGLLAATDPARETTTVRKYVEGRRAEVWSILSEVLYRGIQPDQPDPSN